MLDIELCKDLTLTIGYEAEPWNQGWTVWHWWVDAVNGRHQVDPDDFDERFLDAQEIEDAIIKSLREGE